MSPITEWNQKKVVAEISDRVANNMYAACQYAADVASGLAPRRTGILAEEIRVDVVVEARGQEVIGWVGVRKGRGKRDAFYGFFQEMGTEKMAAHPFLRPAVFGHARQIVRILTGK